MTRMPRGLDLSDYKLLLHGDFVDNLATVNFTDSHTPSFQSYDIPKLDFFKISSTAGYLETNEGIRVSNPKKVLLMI
jgi:hypothetical protein